MEARDKDKETADSWNRLYRTSITGRPEGLESDYWCG